MLLGCLLERNRVSCVLFSPWCSIRGRRGAASEVFAWKAQNNCALELFPSSECDQNVVLSRAGLWVWPANSPRSKVPFRTLEALVCLRWEGVVSQESNEWWNQMRAKEAPAVTMNNCCSVRFCDGEHGRWCKLSLGSEHQWCFVMAAGQTMKFSKTLHRGGRYTQKTAYELSLRCVDL